MKIYCTDFFFLCAMSMLNLGLHFMNQIAQKGGGSLARKKAPS